MKIKDIEIEVVPVYKPTNKNIYFRYGENKLIININNKYDYYHIEEFVRKNIDIVYKFLSSSMKKEREHEENKNSIHFFGKLYNIKIVDSENEAVEIKDDDFILYTRNLDEVHLANMAYYFYLKQLSAYIDSILEKAYLDFANEPKLYKHNSKPTISYKYVRTYYGKCYMKDNHISLNLMLAKYDKVHIKNVLYHEFTHFSVADHSERFYSLFNKKFPYAKQVQSEMKKIKYQDRF